MGKVELTLKEYNDLVEATTTALNQKLELKRELIEAGKRYQALEERNVQLLARCMEVNAWFWIHKFTEEVEITNDNLDDYVAKYIYEDYTREEVLKGVRCLYGKQFNKR
jgi:hypothetical protein